MWQSACLVVNPIMVYSYGFCFNYTMVGQASDSLNSHMASCLHTFQIGKHKVLISSSDLPVWPSLSVELFAVGISFIVVVEVVVMVMDEVVLTRSVVAVVMRSW